MRYQLSLLLACLITVPHLSGCIAVPIVAGANMLHKAGTQTITLQGSKSAFVQFKEAAIRAGGVVSASTADYARAEFATSAVKVELQTIKADEYQLIGSSNTTVARSWDFTDSIAETTQKVADDMVANGFKITASNRVRGL